MKSLASIFPHMSAACAAKNALAGNVERLRAKYEANHNRQIPYTEQCQQTAALGCTGEGEASGPKRPLVGFTLCRVKLLDWDAKWSSVKDLLDGLQKAGLISGDREDQIDQKSYVRQEKVKSYKDEKTVIEIDLP